MKILTISAVGLFALSLAACSPAGDGEGQTSSTTGDTSADATTMPPADSTMMPPADGTMAGSTGTASNGTMTGTNPDGTPMTPAPDGQTSDTASGTPGTTPPVQ